MKKNLTRIYTVMCLLTLAIISSAASKPDLSRLISTATSKPISIYITDTINVSKNITIPENVSLVFSKGGELRLAAGAVLNINGSVEAGSYQIFSGPGMVNGDVKAETILPEWFYSGAYNSEKSDWAPAINKAIALASTGCLKVKLLCRRYNVNSSINLTCVPNNKADMVLEGAVRSTQYEKGTILIGNTGEGKCVVEPAIPMGSV